MKKFAPYVNMETIKDSNGKIERFEIRTVIYLPKDSKITRSGEGTVADKVCYRPLSIFFNGTSEEFDYFGVDFTVRREDVGLLERGVVVKTRSTCTFEAGNAHSVNRAGALSSDSREGGHSIDYEEINP